MVRLTLSEKLNLEATKIFDFIQNELEEYATSLPNVTYFKVLEKKRISKNKIFMKILWEGKGAIPKQLRRLVTPKMIRWLQLVTWDNKNLEADYYIKTFYFSDIFHCQGKWKIIKKDENTSIVKLDGILRIDLPILGGLAERILSKYIYKNIAENMKIIKKILKEKKYI